MNGSESLTLAAGMLRRVTLQWPCLRHASLLRWRAGSLRDALCTLLRQISLTLEGGHNHGSCVPTMSQFVKCIVFTTLGHWLTQQVAFSSFSNRGFEACHTEDLGLDHRSLES